MLDDTTLLQSLFVQINDLDILDVITGLAALIRNKDQPGMWQNRERLFVILRLAP